MTRFVSFDTAAHIGLRAIRAKAARHPSQEEEVNEVGLPQDAAIREAHGFRK
jgi:hypothetical protein